MADDLNKASNAIRSNASKAANAVSDAASDAYDSVSDAAGDAYDKAKGVARDTVKQGKALASDASNAAGQVADVAGQQIRTFASEFEAMAKRNPIGTMAGVLIVGVLIGMITRPRA